MGRPLALTALDVTFTLTQPCVNDISSKVGVPPARRLSLVVPSPLLRNLLSEVASGPPNFSEMQYLISWPARQLSERFRFFDLLKVGKGIFLQFPASICYTLSDSRKRFLQISIFRIHEYLKRFLDIHCLGEFRQ